MDLLNSVLGIGKNVEDWLKKTLGGAASTAGNVVQGLEKSAAPVIQNIEKGVTNYIQNPTTLGIQPPKIDVSSYIPKNVSTSIDNFLRNTANNVSKFQIPGTTTVAGIPVNTGINPLQILNGSFLKPNKNNSTIGDVYNFIAPFWQLPLRSAAEVSKSLPNSQFNTPGYQAAMKVPLFSDIAKVAFGGSGELKSLPQQVKEGVNIPFTETKVKGLGAVPIVAGSTLLNLLPLEGAAEKTGATEAINLAKRANTVEEFAKLIDGAKPEVKTAVEAVLKNAKSPINTISDFFHIAKGKSSIENSVVQIIDNAGNKFYKIIPKGQLADFTKVLDAGQGGVSGLNIGGNIFHLTAHDPAYMEQQGFKFAGTADLNSLKKVVADQLKGAGNAVTDAGKAALNVTEGKFTQAEQGVTNLIGNAANKAKVKDLEARGYLDQQIPQILNTKGAYEKIVKDNIAPFEHSSFPVNDTTRAKIMQQEAAQAGKPDFLSNNGGAGSAELNTASQTEGVTTPLGAADTAAKAAATKTNQTIDTLSNIVDKTTTDVNNKVGLLDYLRTPDRVLQKIGLGKEADLLKQKYEDYLQQLPKEIDKITQWSKEVPKESNQRIFRFLDGQKTDVNGAPLQLTAEETKVAGEIKSYLADWANKLGLPKDKRITNYITHIFEPDFIKKEFDPEIAKMIQGQVAGSVYDPFVQERLGKLGYREDTWAALDAYVKRATRKVNMDVALEQVKKAADNLEESQYKYVERLISRVNLRPTELDNLLDNTIKQVVGYRFGQRPTAYLGRTIRQMVYRGTLGLNVGSALKNLTQGVNTYAKLGEKYTLIGYTDFAKSIATKSNELHDVGVLQNEFIQERQLSATKKFGQAADNVLFSLFQGVEQINRGAAYYGAKAKALAEGKTVEQAIKEAKQLVADTQFKFSPLDTPPVLQSEVGKILLQFQSYTLKQGEFLAEMAKNKQFGQLARYIAGSLVVYGSVGQLIGMRPTDFIPSLRIGASPPFTLAQDAFNTVTGQKDQYGNTPDWVQRAEKIGSDLIPFIPGGVQAKKTIQGLIDTSRGYSETSGGNVKYPITPSAGNAIRAALFGENNLPEAQQFYNNGSNSLSAKQSAAFRALNPEERKLYMQNIQDQRLQGQIDNVRKDIADGNITLDEGLKQITNLQAGKPATGGNPITNFLGSIFGGAAQPANASTVNGNAGDYAKAFGFEKYIQPNTATGIDKYKFEADKAKVAQDIYNGAGNYASIPDAAKKDIYAAMGYTPEQVSYDALASEDVKVKTPYLTDILSQAKDHNEVLNVLVHGRMQSTSGSMLVTDTMLSTFRSQGIISSAEYTELKNLKLDKDGNVIHNASGGGSGLNSSQKSIIKSLASALSSPPKLTSTGVPAGGGSAGQQVKIPSFSVNPNINIPNLDSFFANTQAQGVPNVAPKVAISGRVTVPGAGRSAKAPSSSGLQLHYGRFSQ